MKGIIINIRTNECVEESKNILISMLEKLLSQMDIAEKKRILIEKYNLIMTEEFEGRLQTMCNLSENIENSGIKKGIERERINAIKRMLQANAVKDQILSYGYTEEEFIKAQDSSFIPNA